MRSCSSTEDRDFGLLDFGFSLEFRIEVEGSAKEDPWLKH